MHQTNAAEKVIQTWKNHILVGLASLPADFLIAHLCRLIPQANLMLNLLHMCLQNLSLSAQEAMHGSFHFEFTPMAPTGTKYYIHIKSCKCASWGFHAEDAWYVGPALNYYRCYNVVMKEKTAQCITDNIKFKHHGVKVPNVTPAEKIAKAVKGLTAAVRNDPTEGPLDHIEAVQWLRVVLLNENSRNVWSQHPKRRQKKSHCATQTK
eukprot:13935692-Ditylum_brightwellii.AAC.3